MKISNQFKSNYIEYLKSYLPGLICANEFFERAIEDNFQDIADLATEKVCLARKNGMNLPYEPADLAERVLQLESGHEILAGVRFKNLDVDFPFIEIYKTFSITAEMLIEIQQLIQLEFKNIKPKGFKFRDKPDLSINTEKWSHTVFGTIKTTDKITVEGIRFEWVQDLSWHDLYMKEYRQRLVEKQELDGFVRIGQRDDFEEAAANKSLLLLRDDKGFAGVFAGTDTSIYGLSAIYMIESYLSKRRVGQKIASLAHKNFLNQMSARYKYVWGTIYDKNNSSLKTALSVGRQIIETEYFVSA